MKKYEKDLIIGTLITLAGIMLLVVIGFNMWLSWTVMIIGKFIVIVSCMEYIDYTRRWRGEDLSNDNQFRKIIRKIRKKRYY